MEDGARQHRLLFCYGDEKKRIKCFTKSSIHAKLIIVITLL